MSEVSHVWGCICLATIQGHTGRARKWGVKLCYVGQYSSFSCQPSALTAEPHFLFSLLLTVSITDTGFGGSRRVYVVPPGDKPTTVLILSLRVKTVMV